MAKRTIDHRVGRLAAGQHGLVGRQQATDLGLTSEQVRSRLRRGTLSAVQAGVYRTLGARPTWEQAVLAACLAAGPHALASHRSAAVLWGLADPPAPVEISVPYGRSGRSAGAIVHRSTDLRPIDVARRRHVPLTNPIRTVGDLGAVTPRLVPGAVERGLYLGLFELAALWRLVDELGRPGRRGLGVLRRTLERRALADSPTPSPLEPVFAAIAADTGLQVEHQHRVTVDGHRYVLDFAIPDALIGVEVDGLETHATRQALDHDLERQNRLVVAGWHLLRYTATHLVRRRAAIRRELVELVERRRPAVICQRRGYGAR